MWQSGSVCVCRGRRGSRGVGSPARPGGAGRPLVTARLSPRAHVFVLRAQHAARRLALFLGQGLLYRLGNTHS